MDPSAGEVGRVRRLALIGLAVGNGGQVPSAGSVALG